MVQRLFRFQYASPEDAHVQAALRAAYPLQQAHQAGGVVGVAALLAAARLPVAAGPVGWEGAWRKGVHRL
jgi:hypothetical protein